MILLDKPKTLPETDRGRLKAAFADLRKRGYAARMNFMCCGSCASYALNEKHPDKPHVYWHRQGDAAFTVRQRFGRIERSDDLVDTLYIHWSGDGEEIAAVLRDWGLRVKWEGSDAYCIEVLPR